MSVPQTYKALVTYGVGKEPKIEDLPVQKPGKNQVLIKMQFAPINPSDIQNMQGFYKVPVNPPYTVGLEGSGIIAAIGEDLKVAHQVGDKVHVTALGTYGQYLLANSEDCRKIQGDLPMEEAACHIINPGAVVCMGHLVKKQGNKAAIHTAGSSALGRMFIRYFKHIGVKTINIVRRDDVINELKEEGADYVLNSKAPDFEEKLREIAHREGATVSFEAICGEITEKVLSCQPEDSTCYIYGALEEGKTDKLNAQHFILEGKTVSGLWLTSYFKKKMNDEERKQVFDEMYSLLPTIFKSNIQKVFKLEEIKDALEFYGKNSSKGKILIKLDY